MLICKIHWSLILDLKKYKHNNLFTVAPETEYLEEEGRGAVNNLRVLFIKRFRNLYIYFYIVFMTEQLHSCLTGL